MSKEEVKLAKRYKKDHPAKIADVVSLVAAQLIATPNMPAPTKIKIPGCKDQKVGAALVKLIAIQAAGIFKRVNTTVENKANVVNHVADTWGKYDGKNQKDPNDPTRDRKITRRLR